MKKIIVLILLVTIIFNCKEIYAYQEISNLKVEKIRDCESLLKYKNKIIKTSYVVTKVDEGNYPCYCISPDLPGVGEIGSYNVNIDGKIDKTSLLYKVLINGYPYKSLAELNVCSEDEAYTATKQALYIIIRERYNDMSEYTAVNSESGRRTLNAMKNIVKNALNAIDNENVYKLKNNTEWIKNDIYFTKEYEILGDNIEEYEIDIKGNVSENLEVEDLKNKKFLIRVPISEMTESVDFLINIRAKVKTKPILYGKSENIENQNYAISGIYFDYTDLEFEDSYEKNITSIKIIKKDKSTKERLENVKFEILNENGEVIYKDLTTNNEGEIIIENMIPGKYFIKEIESLEGYEIHKEIIEINVEYNKENIIEIENIKKEIPEKSDISKLPKTGF